MYGPSIRKVFHRTENDLYIVLYGFVHNVLKNLGVLLKMFINPRKAMCQSITHLFALFYKSVLKWARKFKCKIFQVASFEKDFFKVELRSNILFFL